MSDDSEKLDRIIDTLKEHRVEHREDMRMLHKRITDETGKIGDTVRIQGERIARVEAKQESEEAPKPPGGNGGTISIKGLIMIIGAIAAGAAVFITAYFSQGS